jgi:hypothetical protein
LNSQQILHSVTHQNSREIGKFTEQVLLTAVFEESSKYQFIVCSSPDIKTETFSETCVIRTSGTEGMGGIVSDVSDMAEVHDEHHQWTDAQTEEEEWRRRLC